MNPATAIEIRTAPLTGEAPKSPGIANPAEILKQQQQRIERLASGIDGGFNGLAKDTPNTDLSQEKELLAGLRGELDELSKTTQKRIEEVTGGSPAEQQAIPSWEEAVKGEIGEEFRNAVRGQTDGTMYHNGYTMREFVRNHPKEAEIMAKAYEEQFGKSHPDITRAIFQVAKLQKNPIQVPPEDPKYADLDSSLTTDLDYQELYEEIDRAHKIEVFGMTDFQTIPNARFMELANSPKNLSYGSREKALKAEAEFRKLHPDKAQKYTAREKDRVYRDPDGVINPWRDPAIQALREPDSRHQVEKWDLALQRFSQMYPDKAKAYATVIPELAINISPITKPAKPTERKIQEDDNKVIVTELKPVISNQEIQQAIQKQIPTGVKIINDEELDKRRQALAKKPVLSSATLRDTVIGASEQYTFAWIQTDKIVGMAQIRQGGWSSEIQARKGRVIQVAREIIQSEEHPENIEHIFHPDKKGERIKATVIAGPEGPMYLADDGTHRISGAMVAGLAEIPCDVSEIRYPINQTTTESREAQDWRNKTKLGLIDGSVEEYTSPNGVKMSRLSVRSEVVPWIRTYSQADLIQISRVYEKLYPGSLDKLKIPRDALVDPIANNYFMVGRWQEWVDQHSGKSRDEQGIVKYY